MGFKAVNGGERFYVNFSPVTGMDDLWIEQVTHIRYPVFGGWIVWQDNGCSGMNNDEDAMYKTKVENNGNGGMTFVPDPNHEWSLSDD